MVTDSIKQLGNPNELVREVLYFSLFARSYGRGLLDHQLMKLLANGEGVSPCRYRDALEAAIGDWSFDFCAMAPGSQASNAELRRYAERATAQLREGCTWLASRPAQPSSLRFDDGTVVAVSTRNWIRCTTCRGAVSTTGFPSPHCDCGNVTVDAEGGRASATVAGSYSVSELMAADRQGNMCRRST